MAESNREHPSSSSSANPGHASASLPESRLELAEWNAFDVHAVLVGERLDLRVLGSSHQEDRLASGPLALALDSGGIAVLFRYGVIVFFGTLADDEARFIAELEGSITQPHEQRESERMRIRIRRDDREDVEQDTIYLHDRSVERLQLVADVLAESVVLAWYETEISRGFDRVEPVAASLERDGRVRGGARRLLRHIGASLMSEHHVVGRIAIGEKPEILWERGDLEALYVMLESEFEIRERNAAVQRKQELIARTASTVLQVLYTRRSLRVEWYIVILIVVEIVLGLVTGWS